MIHGVLIKKYKLNRRLEDFFDNYKEEYYYGMDMERYTSYGYGEIYCY